MFLTDAPVVFKSGKSSQYTKTVFIYIYIYIYIYSIYICIYIQIDIGLKKIQKKHNFSFPYNS